LTFTFYHRQIIRDRYSHGFIHIIRAVLAKPKRKITSMEAFFNRFK